jgi:hypothetical protein
MKTSHRFIKPLALSAFIIAAFVTIAVWNTTRVRAFNPQPDPPAFGLISLNPGQSLRLNVVNRLTPPPEPDSSASERLTRHASLGFNLYLPGAGGTGPSNADVPPGPCIGARCLATRQAMEVTLAPGEAASFDLTTPTEVGALQALPVMQDDDRNNNPALVYSLEVRESGKTVYAMLPIQHMSR